MVKKKDKTNPGKEQPSQSGTSFKHRNKLIAIGVIAAIVGGIAYYAFELDNPSTTRDLAFPLVDGIPCETKEFFNFHIHAHLDVFVNGHVLTVPALVGIEDNTCLYWLHTHDSTGIMHMEAPQTQNFTLNQFIDIWRSTSTNPPPTGEPIIYVNGQVVTTSLSATELNAHDEIVLVYGNPPPNIPTFYQFPEGL
jgi:hypothetical protein